MDNIILVCITAYYIPAQGARLVLYWVLLADRSSKPNSTGINFVFALSKVCVTDLHEFCTADFLSN